MRWLLWFVLGSCLGSFLNVCIYRMPLEQSLIWPRSRCPHCQHPIAWYDNIPLISFLALAAACRHCRAPIRWRYPLVEAFTGAMTAALFGRFGVTGVSLIYLAFICGLIVCSFIDMEFQIIPDEISIGGLVVGLLASALIPALHGTDSRLLALGRSALGALVGGGLLYGTGIVGDFIFRKETMGGGDIKLLAMAGSILGWKLVTLTFFIAPIIALIPGVLVLLIKRSHVIPYGPFLSIGLVVSLLFGADLLRVSGVEDTVNVLAQYYFHR